jgi:hypothetical protein
MEAASARECVLRALAASEIAESCNRADLRASFFALSEQWLLEAQQFEEAGQGGAIRRGSPASEAASHAP